MNLIDKLAKYAFLAAACVFFLFIADVVAGSFAPQATWLSDTTSAVLLLLCVVCFVLGVVCQEQADNKKEQR